MPETRGRHAPRGRPPAPVAGLRPRELAATTPTSRNRYVDLLRAVAILVVVLGHWTVSAVTVTDGRLGWVNLLRVESWTHPLTWLFQVMPVVFVVGGYANAASWASHRGRGGSGAAWVQARALRLLRPTAAFLAVLFSAYLVAGALGADPGIARASVRAAAISLWFLVVYLAVVACAPVLLAADRRWGPARLLVLAAVVVGAGDAARVLTGWESPAVANYLLAWGAMHELGVAWYRGRLTGTRRQAYALLVGGLAATIALTGWGPYGVTMVGAAPPPDLTNTAPPTLALLTLALAQTGVVLLLRDAADRWLARSRVWTAVVAVNAVALTVYLWHMVPVVVAGTTLVGGGVLPQREVGSAAWFLWRLPWLGALTVLLAGIVALSARWERRPATAREGEPSPVVLAAGVVACLGGLAGLGVGGPDGLLRAVAGVPVAELTLFAAGLALVTRRGRRSGAP